ncbi:MAG: glycerol-3-phosphate acyltransferase, partial [Planctomycetia bacterium]
MSPFLVTFLVLAGAWLLGSIPWSWLLVRWRTGKDLAAEGSGNVGALNSLRVSRSRGLGVLALLLDLLKGVAAVLGARAAGAPESSVLAAGVCCVAGHALNPWLTLARGRPSGGKGFASAAGVMLPCAPWLVAGWLGVLVLAYVLFRAL